MRQVLLGAAIALVLVCTATPASADTRTVADTASDGAGLPAPYDITGVTWDYDDERLLVTTDVAGVRRKGVVLTARSAHDGEGYQVVARTWWRNGAKFDRLWIWFNTVDRTSVDCPGLSSRWRLHFIRLSVPNQCLFNGAAMRDFSSTTNRLGYPGVIDRVASAQTLTSD